MLLTIMMKKTKGPRLNIRQEDSEHCSKSPVTKVSVQTGLLYGTHGMSLSPQENERMNIEHEDKNE